MQSANCVPVIPEHSGRPLSTMPRERLLAPSVPGFCLLWSLERVPAVPSSLERAPAVVEVDAPLDASMRDEPVVDDVCAPTPTAAASDTAATSALSFHCFINPPRRDAS